MNNDQVHPETPSDAATTNAGQPPPHSLREFIDRATTTVEHIHTSIANLPLDMIEAVPGLTEPMKVAKKVQARWIGTVYDVVRRVNSEVAKLASDVTTPKQ